MSGFNRPNWSRIVLLETVITNGAAELSAQIGGANVFDPHRGEVGEHQDVNTLIAGVLAPQTAKTEIPNYDVAFNFSALFCRSVRTEQIGVAVFALDVFVYAQEGGFRSIAKNRERGMVRAEIYAVVLF